MKDQGQPKSSVEEIRKRFDAEVERFSNLETGQAATVDSPLAMTLIAEVAAAVTPEAASVLDIGCGAGNYTLKLLERLPNLNVMLIDLSRPMLDRAMDRIRPATTGSVEAIQGDIREIDIGVERHDIILAASVLHHLRTDAQWRAVFEEVLPGVAAGRGGLDLRSDRECDPRGPGDHAAAVWRVPDAGERRGVPGSSLCLH